jgi:hypothetical protein
MATIAVAGTSIPNAAAASSPTLSSFGYTLLPEPHQVQFNGAEFQFGNGRRLTLDTGVRSDDVAVQTLEQGLADRDHVSLKTHGKGSSPTIELAIQPGSVTVGQAADKNTAALAEQAYELDLTSNSIRITANASTGLLYGVDTLVQLVKSAQGKLWLPVAHIADWPDVELRNLFWDDSEHLDKPNVLKAAIRQASFYKVNGFVLKLDGHFQYKSAPALAQPDSMSPEQLQELTNYGLRYHVQVIPFLDGPGHDSWILKHPEYASLREYANSNYEMCVINPGTYKLLDGLYQDLLNANKGVKYFVLSTDEPYYVGHVTATESPCNEAAVRQQLGSPGLLEAQFLNQAGGYLHDRGRTVQFWGEFPLKNSDISALPNWLINGETDGPATDPVYAANGIRQTIYSSAQGTELMFPNYFFPPGSTKLGETENLFSTITNDPVRTDGGDPMGVFVAAWADSGLHPETFWLGFVSGASWAWHPGTPSAADVEESFYKLYYGQGAGDTASIYQLMSTQAETYQSSWDNVPSTSRPPIWGNSNGPFNPPRPATDQSVPLPGVPAAGTLQLSYDWSGANAARMQQVTAAMADNSRLLDLLNTTRNSVQFHQDGLGVFESIAQLERQNLQMLTGFSTIDADLKHAQAQAQVDSGAAVKALDSALNEARTIRTQRNTTYHDTVLTWDKTWVPKVSAGDGREALDIRDSVKDHLPNRTTDMTYLILRELLLPVSDWYANVEAVRNEYAQSHGLPSRTDDLAWSDRGTFGSRGALGSQPEAQPRGRATAYRVLAPSSGTLNELSVYLDSGTTSKSVAAGIYADDHNHPGSLLAQGQIVEPKAGAWNAVPLPSTLVSGGQPYWIAVAGNGGRLVLRDLGSGVGSEPADTGQPGPGTGLPAAWATTNEVERIDGPVLAYAQVQAGQ